MRGLGSGLACLMALTAPAIAATHGVRPAQPVAAEATASAASAAETRPARISPYVIAARQHAQAASDTAHAPAVPPTMRRTQQAIGRWQQH